MATVVNSTQTMVGQLYDYYLWTLSLADQRSRGMLMVDSPVPTLLYTVIYLVIVGVGPRLMKDRKPFKLTWCLVPYNLAMSLLNLYIAIELLIASTRLKYSYVCQPIRHIDSKEELRIVNAVWWYYFSKLLEFCDTFFFILRKKEKQLTFLHVYHHSTMFSLWWIGIKWVPSGSTFLPAMVNSFIHVLMYSYYGLSALGPGIAKYLWWKKYLTMLQLVQFTTALILGINGIRSGCDFPLWMQYALVIYMISFIVLFGNFYAKAYIEKVKRERVWRCRNLDQDNGSRSLSSTCRVSSTISTHYASADPYSSGKRAVGYGDYNKQNGHFFEPSTSNKKWD